MTKHTYKAGNLTGVVIAGEYQKGNIREALKKFRNPFELRAGDYEKKGREKEVWCCFVMHEPRVPFALAVSYHGKPTNPKDILASALDLTGIVDEQSLKGYLNELLEATEIIELESQRSQFESEPFAGWRRVQQMRRL